MHASGTDKQASIPAWKSPWVIAWIALVVIVLGVNLVMVYLAVTTNPGLVVEDYYERGQNYEHTLFSKNAGNPGWVLRLDAPQDIGRGEPTPIRFFVVDKAGQPVSPQSVTLFVYRPSDAAQDFNVPMELQGPGRYMALVSFPLLGIWDTLVAAADASGEYQVGQRIRVQHPQLISTQSPDS